MDETQQHSTVIDTDNPRARRWLRDFGSMDIKGIDTKHPRLIKVTASKRRRQSSDRNLGAGIVETRTKYGKRRHLKLT
jgi:hypothetical protein